MCLSCGCALTNPELVNDDHGDSRQITLSSLVAAADANGISPAEVVAMIGASLQVATPAAAVAKAEPEQRFLLGLAYQAGRRPEIRKGIDGGRDYFEPADLERASWSFMLNGHQHGLFHLDGTEGVAKTVESGIYRNSIPWVVSPDLIVRQGDWTVGVLTDDKGWGAYKAGRIGGMSPQGAARRLRVSSSSPA